jgi:hypothetical protein
MLSRQEIEQAISECEAGQASYQQCQKLATLYTLYDHLYAGQEAVPRYVDEEVVGDYGDDEFFATIRGKNAATVWDAVGELVDAVSILNPKLYDSFMEKIE